MYVCISQNSVTPETSWWNENSRQRQKVLVTGLMFLYSVSARQWILSVCGWLCSATSSLNEHVVDKSFMLSQIGTMGLSSCFGRTTQETLFWLISGTGLLPGSRAGRFPQVPTFKIHDQSIPEGRTPTDRIWFNPLIR